ncbi:hypothetical protein WOSG25_031420 [Weissella oryzae SG25]|uniref:Uncharacterized protein n=1 Tax=Weissella oryzae (strain DSM 25784 / JCM 18191 / LMG 30913 / SG25) TaxID=1329250 RepID=A0A069CRX0_WEIOS|nr:hypothetical protein [Weissella oryzae]GAK30545.1 hypothetical protein WOSG25_031420 [Weissella oryzae SG25]
MSMILSLLPFSGAWSLGFEAIAAVLVLPTGLYFAGHTLLHSYPKLFNALHWLFGLYIVYVLVVALMMLIIY